MNFFRAHLNRPDGLVPPAWHAIFANRFSVHASFEAFFQSAELAAVSLLPRHHAHFVSRTAVHAAIADRALEEAFASFAADDSIVQASCSIAADSTLLLAISRVDVRLIWIFCKKIPRDMDLSIRETGPNRSLIRLVLLFLLSSGARQKVSESGVRQLTRGWVSLPLFGEKTTARQIKQHLTGSLSKSLLNTLGCALFAQIFYFSENFLVLRKSHFWRRKIWMYKTELTKMMMMGWMRRRVAGVIWAWTACIVEWCIWRNVSRSVGLIKSLERGVGSLLSGIEVRSEELRSGIVRVVHAHHRVEAHWKSEDFSC